MPANKVQTKGWPVKAVSPPRVSDALWMLAAIPGAILIVMAVLQIISFTDYKNALRASGLHAAAVWGLVIIICELWGAVGFYKLRLSLGFRYVSYVLALFAVSFWFVDNLQWVTNNSSGLPNSGFFGRFLTQTPGWWTVVQVSIFLFWVLYTIKLLRDNQQTPTSNR